MKVVFLHIPKTAGQSVHNALVDGFGEKAVCPARVNDQLKLMSIKDINKFDVFSGHHDWSLLDCVKGKKFVFTVLREPMDRILSFYFYLRDSAAKLDKDALNMPNHYGMKAALEWNPNDYFCGGPKHFRSFIDDHYDNFYTYYFAGRSYRARSLLINSIKNNDLSFDELSRIALENLNTLDAVYSISEVDRVLNKISELSGKQIKVSEKYRINVNNTLASNSRLDQLIALGANSETQEKLQSYVKHDNTLWQSCFKK